MYTMHKNIFQKRYSFVFLWPNFYFHNQYDRMTIVACVNSHVLNKAKKLAVLT